MIEDTMKFDKLYHACSNALYVVEHLLTTCTEDDKETLRAVREELRAALNYQEAPR